ncbi:MAG: MFS transporter [Pseudohongiellaceae bacterium]
MLEKIQRNIKLIYGLAFSHSFMVIMPVIVPFFMSKGLSLSEIFYLQVIYALTIVLLEAPSGYFADLLGRRIALICGSVAHGLGYFYLNLVDGFAGLVIFEVTVGVAASLLSGADLALLYDSQRALQEEDLPHSSGIAHLGFLKSLAEGLGALFGGVLAMYSFDLMIIIQSVSAWICLGLALQLAEPPSREEESGHDLRLATILRFIWYADPVLRNVFIAIPAYNLATLHVAWLVQPYWESQGISLAVFGVLWCLQSITTGVASRIGYVIERHHGAIFSLALIGVLPIVGLFGLAIVDGGAGMVLGLLLFFGRGLNQVILVNALNRRVPGAFRATVNSLTGFSFRLAFIVSGPLIGYVAEYHGLHSAFLVLAVSSICFFGLIMLPLIKSVQYLLRAPL